MSTVRRFWFSPVDYRPDPSLPDEGKIPLGVVVEAEFRHIWVVAVQARAMLADDDLARLDGAGKELLREPAAFIARAVESVLPQAKKPGDVLRLLAQRGQWSFHVASPSKKELLGAGKAPRIVVLRKLEALYAEKVGRGKPLPSAALPWAAPPQQWEVPLAAHA